MSGFAVEHMLVCRFTKDKDSVTSDTVCCDRHIHHPRLSSMEACNIQLPFELVEIIISEFWYAKHPSDDSIVFMTRCSLICSLWRDVYASITSRDIYVPIVRYLFYLSSIDYHPYQTVFHLPPFSPRIYTYLHLSHRSLQII